MNAVRTARPSSSIARYVGCFGPPRVKRRKTCSASAVPRRRAVVYLICPMAKDELTSVRLILEISFL